VRPPLQDLERLLGHGYQLLAQLTAIKTMLLQRRDRLDFARLQPQLEQAKQAIARALKQGALQQHAIATLEETSPMLALPDVPEQDLTPWMQRRLQLAVDIAGELQADAGRAVVR
jgi:hypothetical protein